ncbi:hypothetical protein Tco_0937817 [Tanacetum coccineum]|uniref:Uncharacterized protein n=1 Tax=Tanacetum coccineum TaxID=301880 RepID=A0ABQ5DHY8_9ASTR
MHQPWRTLSSIVNKCLSGKTTSNDRLHKSRVAIIWGMFHKKDQVDINLPDLSQILHWPDTSEEKHRTTGRRRTTGVVIQDTPNVPKKKSVDQSQKLKGIQTLTPKEQLATDTMQALKASKRISRSRPHTRGSSEGTGVSTGVLDESIVIFIMSSDVIGASEAKADSTLDWGSKEESEYSEEENVDEEIEWLSTDDEEENQEEQDDDNDDKSIDIEETDKDERREDDEYVHNDEYVHKEDDEEMKDVDVAATEKDEN